ncbi:hypothetical protein N7478_005978 [Penicillium angulare]|uniref:uncharacterized protein n=1 Tax=Penicillium angulare TaxID=116970 RepID=UPI0025419A4E|nr:uncharacterized protein N7478_005978 [Penicillium angulare]KAJ5280606.1 hypothetical protein N7478_005978 [Penicillium angulare]
MSYYDDRRYGEGHGRDYGYAADYYDEHPDNRRRATQREYGSRQARRPADQFRRRASSVGGESSYYPESRSQRRSSRPYEGHQSPVDYQQPDSGSSSSESSRSSRHQNRRKSTGGASRGSGHQDRYRSRDQGREDSESDEERNDSDRNQGHSSFLRDKGEQLLMHAALPLLAAGAAEAFRTRKQPGEWRGDKGKQVMSAAFTNGLVNKDPSKPQHHHIMDTTLPGLHEGAPSREEIAELRSRAGGSRRSSNLKKAAAAGVIAFAGKELYDRYGRSRSQARGHDYNDDRHRSRKRNQSVSDDRRRGARSLDREERDYERRPRG